MRLVFILVFLAITISATADEFIVKHFSYNSSSQIAERYPRLDQNKQVCALVLIETKMREVIFQADIAIVGDIRLKQGKYYVYLPATATTLKFTKTGLEDFNYQIPLNLHPSGVYNLVLEKIIKKPKEKEISTNTEKSYKSTSVTETGKIGRPNTKTINKPDKTDTSIAKKIDDDHIFLFVEVMPEFPGGESEMYKFIRKNINYPRMAKESGVSGLVFLTFVVERDGRITDIQILRGIGAGCDEEAIRVINRMSYWNPGTQGGKSVRVQYKMPIKFTLQ